MSIVVFDAHAPVGAAQAVYVSALAGQLSDADAVRAIEHYSDGSQQRGARPWAPQDVQHPARLRLYQAIATEHFVLDSLDVRRAGDERVPVSLERRADAHASSIDADLSDDAP